MSRYRVVGGLRYARLTQVLLATREVRPLVDEPIVVKQLHKHMADDPAFVEAFLTGATHLRGLTHPHIIRTLDAGVIDGKCCIAEEYVEGQALRLVLRRAYGGHGLPDELAVYIAVCMLKGLHHAHEAKAEDGRSLGLVHRDLSPDSVFISNDGAVKITDFAVAESRAGGAAPSAGLRRDGAAYLAPEQDGGTTVDRRADVWSVGVVLWEVLTGRRLFADDTDPANVDPEGKRRIQLPSSVRRDVPAALDAIVARALCWDVAGRYQNALDMQLDLERLVRSTSRDADPAAALGALMHRLFPNEVVEQRRLVTVLGGGDDPAKPRRTPPPPIPPPPPSSTRSPSSTAKGSLPALPPPPVGPSTRPSGRPGPTSTGALTLDDLLADTDDAEPPPNGREGSTKAGALHPRLLVAVAVFCAGLSAAATYVVFTTTRRGSALVQVGAEPNGVSSESSLHMVPEQPPAPNRDVAGAEPAAVVPSMPGDTPESTTAEDVRPPNDEPSSARSSTAPQRRAKEKTMGGRADPSSHVDSPRAALGTPVAKADDAPNAGPDTARNGEPESPPQAKADDRAAPTPAAAAPSIPESGFLTVDTSPWSIVSEGGKVLGQTPLVHVELAAGVHVLSLKNPELGVQSTYAVTIVAGQTLVKRIGIE